MVADRPLVRADALEAKPAPAHAPEPTGRTCADCGTGGGRVPSDGGRELRAGSVCDGCWGTDDCRNTEEEVVGSWRGVMPTSASSSELKSIAPVVARRSGLLRFTIGFWSVGLIFVLPYTPTLAVG